MNHATVKLGDYKIPLIGIDESATEETCDKCRRVRHISLIRLAEDGSFICHLCSALASLKLSLEQ